MKELVSQERWQTAVSQYQQDRSNNINCGKSLRNRISEDQMQPLIHSQLYDKN